MNTPAATARVTGLLARRAPRAVLFRRGPSKQVQQLLWNLDTDEITPGQWLKARVYTQCCDLSPDGKHLIYFAATHRPDPVTHGTHIAISRPPYFTALTLYPVGHTWGGTGRFIDEKRYWVDTEGPGTGRLERQLGRAPGLREVPMPPPARKGHGWEEATMDGWRYIGGTQTGQTWRKVERTLVWHKPIGAGWTLERRRISGLKNRGPNGEPTWMRHSLIHEDGNEGPLPLNDGWADSFAGDVIYAVSGRVYRHAPGTPPQQIADLNPNRFQPMRAPYPGLNRFETAPHVGKRKRRKWHPLNGEAT